jgi:hypothetical protein
MPLAGVKMAKKFMYFDSSKAVRQLGLPQTPVPRPSRRRWTGFGNTAMPESLGFQVRSFESFNPGHLCHQAFSMSEPGIVALVDDFDAG